MKAAISTVTAVALLSFLPLALAGSEQDRIAALEARPVALEAKLSAASASKPTPAPAPARSSLVSELPSAVPAAMRFAGFAALGGVPPIFGATITGGGAVTSANMPDPYTPTDGTWNITGHVTVAGSGSTVTSPRFAAGSLLQLRDDANGAEIRGYAADSGTAKALVFSANADYSTAGAKIASFGDNAGASYAEKAYFTKDGDLYSDGFVQADYFNAGNSLFYHTGGITDASLNALVYVTDDGTTGRIQSTSTKQTGTITLSGGSGTASVRSGAVCVCTDTTAVAAVQCAVATTTLTATGTGSDVIAYWCN